MARITSVDPADVDRVADGLDRIADRFGVSVDRLRGVIAAEGACWGDDEFGKKFAGSYTPGSGDAVEQSDAMTESVRKLSENLRLIARAFDRLDTGGSLELGPG